MEFAHQSLTPSIFKRLELKILFTKYILILLFDPIWSFLKPRNEEKKGTSFLLDEENETEFCSLPKFWQLPSPRAGVRALNPEISAFDLCSSFSYTIFSC